MIRLLLADDHSIVREGLKKLLALTPDIQVIAEACDGPQALAAVQGRRFDLLLLDLSMPGLSGIELIVRIREAEPRLPVLVLSMLNEPQIVKRALKAGAAGYLTKDCDPERLFSAIRKIAAGGHAIDPAIAEQFVLDVSTGNAPLHELLSNREHEILRLIAKGVSLKEIAAILGISSKTVSTHKARMTAKMGFRTNADLIRYAMVHGMDT
jgi:DNA-binding NarL/FixJ family response regulator